MTGYHSNNTSDESSNFESLLSVAIDGKLFQTWTALPGEIVEFDTVTQLAKIQPSVRMQFTKPNNEVEHVNLPLLINVPVQFPGATSGFKITFPLQKGDTGLLIFCSRSIDNWIISGEVQNQTVRRKHDLSDAIFIPGVANLKNRTGISDPENEDVGFQNNSIEIRNDNRTLFVSLCPDENCINIGGNVIIDGNLTVTGGLSDTGLEVQSGTAKFAKGLDVNTGDFQVNPPDQGETYSTIKIDENSNFKHGDDTDIGRNHTHGGVTAGIDDTGAVN